MDIIQRKLLIEQTKKELLDSLKQYQVGLVFNGEILASKDSDNWNGYLFIIPNEKYDELFPSGNNSRR